MKLKSVQGLFVMGCLSVAPLLAQTTTTTTTGTATTSTATSSTSSTKTTTTGTAAKTKTTAKARRTTGTSASAKTRVNNDATRLAGLLRDAQTTVTVNPDVWKTIGNEANSLSNRIYGATGGNAAARKSATNARTHVQKFRDAAASGDAAGAREHANEAMPFVVELIEWSSPASPK